MTPVLFQLQACDGPCLANGPARRRLGAQAGEMLRIATARGDAITRVVHKIPLQILPQAKDNWIWINVNDFHFLGLEPGDTVEVSRSDEAIECP